MRSLIALALLITSAPAIPQTPPMTPDRLHEILPASEPEQPDVVFQNYPLVKRIGCAHSSGTGFRIGDNHMMTAAHVSAATECGVEDLPISVTEQDTARDYARFNVAIGTPNGFQIDCNGYKPGHWYWAIGHALGASFQTAVAIWSTIYFDRDGKRIFVGKHTVIPGMSGGPIIDPETGRVVGIVNAYQPGDGLSFSRELKSTSLCGAA